MNLSGAPASSPEEGFVLWTAALVCPVVAPPVREGAVLVRGGRIETVGPAERLRAEAPDAARANCGRALLVPGLVNAHTHLELSGLDFLRVPCPPEADLPGGIAGWIVRLVRAVREWDVPLLLASARMGTAASLAAGVTCVGDISRTGQSALALADAGMRGVVFHEVAGLEPGRAEEAVSQWVLAREELPRLRGGLEGGLRNGVSPHAPYTTSLALYRRAIALARERGWPCATHLAESPAETEFLETGGGPLARTHLLLESPTDLFRPPGLSPVRYLHEGGALEGISLAVHCNRTGPEEWEILRRAGVRACLCPRSAAFFGHPVADAAGMREAGLGLCLGTDSLASAPSLSPLEEAAALREIDPGLSPEALLRMCTRAGAEALGLEGEGVGALLRGGVADFALVEPPPGDRPPEPEDLFAPGARVARTVVGGEAR